MMKYTFNCKSDKTGEWDLKIVIIANDKNEALNILSNKYHSVTNYYSSDILEEQVKDLKLENKEVEACWNSIYKESRIALGMLIGSVGGLIAGNQVTTKNKTLGQTKKMNNLNTKELYKSASYISNCNY